MFGPLGGEVLFEDDLDVTETFFNPATQQEETGVNRGIHTLGIVKIHPGRRLENLTSCRSPRYPQNIR